MRKRIPYAHPSWSAELSNNRRFYGGYCEKVSIFLSFIQIFRIHIHKSAIAATAAAIWLHLQSIDLAIFAYILCVWAIGRLLRSLCPVFMYAIYMYIYLHFMVLLLAVIKPHHFIFVTPELLRTILRK